MASFERYFSVLALFILFRETIEASIICSVLLQFLNRSKPGLKRAVWWGVAAGVGVSIIFGAIFIAVYYTAQNNLFQGKNRDWFKGIISWIAALLITILGFAMLRFLGWESKWKRKLTAALKAKVEETADPATSSTGELSAAPEPLKSLARTSGGRKTSSDSETATTSAANGPDRTPTGSPSKPAPRSSDSPVKEQASVSSAVDRDSVGAADVAKKSLTLAESQPNPDATLADMMAVPPSKDAAAVAAASAAADAGIDLTPPTRKEALKIWLLVFTTVVREGIESVVFLGGLGNVPLTAIPLPAIVGIICGCLVGVFLYYSGKQVKHIKWLVIGMAIVIFFIAAGQVNIGTDSLMKAGAFGYCSPWLDERPWYMIPMYDWSACCSDIDPTGNEPTDVQNRKRFFALVRAIFGYQDKATPIEVMLYCGYWSLVFALASWKSWRGTLFDADYKFKRQQRREAQERRRQAEEKAREAAEAAEVKKAASIIVVTEDAACGERTPKG